MDSFELNKIMGAILGTCLGLLSLNIAANAIFHPVMPAKPGYNIAVPETPAGGDQKSAPAQQDPPLADLLPGADLARGEVSHQKCIACHTFDKGGRNLVGPNLYGIIGREKGAVAGFNYSAGFKKLKGPWTVQELSDFVKNPKLFAPGTSMTFAGIPRPSERADLITYLNSKSDNPQNLKAAEAK